MSWAVLWQAALMSKCQLARPVPVSTSFEYTKNRRLRPNGAVDPGTNMDITEMSQRGRKVTSYAEMKTDLNLLLECLKFQMDNPDSQKETLVAVRAICQDNSDACDYFREIGGLLFLNNLAKSSTHCILKQASLYTLAVLAENNVYCQQTLCTSALFEDVYTVLVDEQSSINLKWMCVFVFLVLVSNNKTGQSLARESGCIDVLLLIFSKMLTCNMILASGNTNPQYQLWLSVCSALCTCVNNPQNEENQKLCSSVFPQAIEWLEGSFQHEIARPMFSMIGLTVANCRYTQDYFASIGGLDILADILSHLVNGSQVKSFDFRLAIAATKTLDACIAENSKSIHHLSKHSIISSLMSLLSCGTLEAEDKFSIVLAVGHLTEDCEANQYELLKSKGLPLMIQVLAETQDDELHKAATFVLQNCRCITEMLSLNENEHLSSINLCSVSSHKNQKDRYLDEYRGQAKEIFHKIQYLQQQYDENIDNIEVPDRRENDAPKFGKAVVASMLPLVPSCLNHSKYRNDKSMAAVFHEELKHQDHFTSQKLFGCLAKDQRPSRDRISLEKVRQQIFLDMTKLQKSAASTSGRLSKTCNDSYIAQETCADLLSRDQTGRPESSRNNITSRDAVSQTLPNHVMEKLHDLPSPHTELSEEDEQTSPKASSVRILRLNTSKHSSLVRHDKLLDPMMICADVIDREISSILDTHQHPLNEMPCSGCLVTGHIMNSRNCNKILIGCPSLCVRHRVILQTEERYRTECRNLLHGTGHAAAQKSSSSQTGKGRYPAGVTSSEATGILLTPIRKANPRSSKCVKTCSLQVESSLETESDRDSSPKRQAVTPNQPHAVEVQPPGNPDQKQPQKGRRKDFTQREIANLLDGVEKFGYHWNAILWSYPFQQGRKNVDLAKKYKLLKEKQ
ncbi:telomere repeats-binding bouquet formation protein 1 isoform X5 [Hyla sarda]|uniref:telomere repeats-binding bouquet formation protein 1 isoform X5 n=1 Tax=Hyla sarda TaxID=327740 RepID=UPI0024C394F4|nr:telomere repeats-binding bouquet formation protein 1 isoform X5 [Hyla sarda]